MTTYPTPAQLATIAVHSTDFIGDLTEDREMLETNIRCSSFTAGDIWEDAHPGVSLPYELFEASWLILRTCAHAMLDAARRAQEESLADAQQDGDVDADGEFIEYPRYRSV